MIASSLLSSLDFTHTEKEVKAILNGEMDVPASRTALRELFSFMDYTSLDGTDNHATITRLCQKARAFSETGLPHPAAVCLFMPFIGMAKKSLAGTPIKTATVAAAFPHGQMPLHLKLAEVKYSAGEGADEIDVVISRGKMMEGAYSEVFDELQQIRAAAGDTTLKVILETGELGNHENIARASALAIDAGADFIKTSTGKITPAATEEAVFVMLKVIQAFYHKTGKRIGIKPAGGISEPQKALNYYRLVQEIAGPEWLCRDLFRIGASRLAEKIIAEIGPNPTLL